MGVVRVLATLVGLLQSLIGIFTIILAYLIYYSPKFLNISQILRIRSEYAAFFILILGIVGFFSIVSGILIIYEWGSS